MHEFTRALLEQICSRQHSLVIGIGFAVALLFVSVISTLVADPGSATRVISIVNIATLLVLLLVGGFFLRLCNQD